MIKSVLRRRDFLAIYRFLDRFSPIEGDCGRLCDAACCGTAEDRQWDEKMGIYLLPGEDKVHDKKDDWLIWSEESTEEYEFPPSWRGKVFFVKCKDAPHCPREKRPLQCRTFPLAPHFPDEGHLVLIWDTAELPYSCPLIRERRKLDHDFVKATYTVWRHLVRDPLILDLIEMNSLKRVREKKKIELVYDPIRPDLNRYIERSRHII